MVEFLSSITAYLKTILPSELIFKQGIMDIGKEQFAIRLVPTAPGPRYMNKKRIRVMQFQIIGKSMNQALLISRLEDFQDMLEDGFDGLVNSTYDIIMIEATSEPAYVEHNSENEYIYSTFYRAELIKRG